MAKTEQPAKVKFLDVKKAGTRLVFEFGDKVRLEFDPARCNEATRELGMYHGFNQKIRDSAAGFSKSFDYAGAREEMAKVIESLYANVWNRQGGGAGAGVIMEDLAYAISKVKNASIERAMAAVEKADEDQRKTWAKNPKVAALMAEHKAARLARAAQNAEELDITLDGEEESGENGK